MRILILGGDGMLGHKVFQTLASRYEMFATFREPRGAWTRFPMYARAESQQLIGGVNALDFHSIVRAVAQVQPDVIINCIGIIKQLKQANDPILSITINALLPHRLADLCAASRARLFHISTDCVFSGRKGNYTEDDLTDAEDLYGRSKLLGEVNRADCLTLRTSIIGREFLKTTGLLEWFLSQRGGTVNGYRHAIYTGVTTQTLAQIIGDVIADQPRVSGIYQVASERITKYELLIKIRAALKLDITINPFDDPPCDRSLSAARFVAATGYRIPTWDEMIDALARDATPYDDWRKQNATA
ncbi:MAG: SDR family oxidoreductase [Chloroflexi bacterium]|nr:SDR family oxidoreductase [Chloroflexota bacterium]